MVSLINLLVIFFIILLSYQIFLASRTIEGLENNDYQPYDTNNPQNALILAQQNAGNIIVLKQQVDEVKGLNKEVKDIKANVATLSDQFRELAEANKKYTSEMVGTNPPTITGV